MPENSNHYIVSFNKVNAALLRRHIQAFKDRVGLDNSNTLVSKTDTTKVNNNLQQSNQNMENVPIQKPQMPRNPYGRIYYGHPVFNPFEIGPKFVEDGGNI